MLTTCLLSDCQLPSESVRTSVGKLKRLLVQTEIFIESRVLGTGLDAGKCNGSGVSLQGLVAVEGELASLAAPIGLVRTMCPPLC